MFQSSLESLPFQPYFWILESRIAGCGTGTSAAARSRRLVHEQINQTQAPEAVICWWMPGEGGFEAGREMDGGGMREDISLGGRIEGRDSPP
jgi:hypothetical protein